MTSWAAACVYRDQAASGSVVERRRFSNFEEAFIREPYYLIATLVRGAQ